jgi:hypothetical protein
MALSWSERRKYTYSAVVVCIVLLVFFAAYRSLFSAPTSCFDNRHNGDEEGVDCGGSCTFLCTNQVSQPTVAWARSFLVATSTYTAAAYIQNPNPGAGAHQVAYSFQLFDSKNSLIVERTGVVDLAPVQMVPIIEPNIPTGSREVARTLFAFSGLPPWQRVDANMVPQVSTANQKLMQDGSRLSLTLQNNGIRDAKNLTVIAVLFDASGVALAASKSLVASLPHKSSQDIVFTWNGGVPNVVRAEITVLPSF